MRLLPRAGYLRAVSTAGASADTILADGRRFERDEWTNAPPSILARIPRRLHAQPSHPIGIIRALIADHFAQLSGFRSMLAPSPVVTVAQNFDELGFAPDHPGRSRSDTYYLDRAHLLRTHTSAHEVEIFGSGHERWLLAADVYRRDEIDASHYPVFHQMEGAFVCARERAMETFEAPTIALEAAVERAGLVVEDDLPRGGPSNPYQDAHDPAMAAIIVRSLKAHLNSLVLALFGRLATEDGQPLKVRWIEATFPWTGPSFEVEVFFRGKWLEILGCGVMQQHALERSGVGHKVGWAFGLGLERLAMVLFSIPDIRLFWSTDDRFLSQFGAERGLDTTFKPYSRFPALYQDISFWLPDASFHANDFYEIVREVAGDLVEDTVLVRRQPRLG